MALLPNALVSESYSSGKQLRNCLERVEAAISGEDAGTAVSSLLIMAVYLQAPHLTEDQIQDIVYNLSKHTCLLLTGTDETSGELKH